MMIFEAGNPAPGAIAMSHQEEPHSKIPLPILREAILKARRITSMLQGTMSLEGQGLDKQTLREMTKRSARDFLALRR
jgi:hypothetical protein